MIAAIMETVHQFLKKLNIKLPYDLVSLLVGIYQKNSMQGIK